MSSGFKLNSWRITRFYRPTPGRSSISDDAPKGSKGNHCFLCFLEEISVWFAGASQKRVGEHPKISQAITVWYINLAMEYHPFMSFMDIYGWLAKVFQQNMITFSIFKFIDLRPYVYLGGVNSLG